MPATMPTPAPPDFRLYHSNSLEVLAGMLAREGFTGTPSLLKPQALPLNAAPTSN